MFPASDKISLNKIGDQTTVESLIKLLGDIDPMVRQVAIEALAQTGDERAISPLIALLEDQSADVRFHLIAALCVLDPKNAALHITRFLEDPDSSVRASAAAALGDLNAIGSADQISLLLNDESLDTRIEAALALARFSDPRCIEVLIKNLNHPEYGHLAGEQLYHLADPKTVPQLSKAIRSSRGNRVAKVWAAGTLVRLNNPVGKKYLLNYAKSKNAIICGLANQLIDELERLRGLSLKF